VYTPITGISKLTAYLDAIGFGDPLSIVWEAIPFSFLADYFISVGKFLSQFDHDFYVTPISFVDFAYSVKSIQRYTYAYQQAYVSPYRSTVNETTPDAYYVHKRYVRHRINPPSLSGELSTGVDLGLLEFRRPSFRQMFLMANLFNVLRR